MQSHHGEAAEQLGGRCSGFEFGPAHVKPSPRQSLRPVVILLRLLMVIVMTMIVRLQLTRLPSVAVAATIAVGIVTGEMTSWVRTELRTVYGFYYIQSDVSVRLTTPRRERGLALTRVQNILRRCVDRRARRVQLTRLWQISYRGRPARPVVHPLAVPRVRLRKVYLGRLVDAARSHETLLPRIARRARARLAISHRCLRAARRQSPRPVVLFILDDDRHIVVRHRSSE